MAANFFLLTFSCQSSDADSETEPDSDSDADTNSDTGTASDSSPDTEPSDSEEDSESSSDSEHTVFHRNGRVHVLLSHMPDNEPDDSNFSSARNKSRYFHYWRDSNATWHREEVGLSVIANFRGKLAVASSGNLYAFCLVCALQALVLQINFRIGNYCIQMIVGHTFPIH